MAVAYSDAKDLDAAHAPLTTVAGREKALLVPPSLDC